MEAKPFLYLFPDEGRDPETLKCRAKWLWAPAFAGEEREGELGTRPSPLWGGWAGRSPGRVGEQRLRSTISTPPVRFAVVRSLRDLTPIKGREGRVPETSIPSLSQRKLGSIDTGIALHHHGHQLTLGKR